MKKIIIFAALAVLCSCKGSEGDAPQPNVSKEMIINGLSDDHWTYFSFDTGEVVGTGKFDDDADDAAWAKRTDWDLAICGDLIKTNGGDSGVGLGGVQKNNTHNFTTLETAPVEGYLEDEVQIIR